jgi:putative flippase GtrA
MKRFIRIRQIRFALVGGLNTAIDFFIFIVLTSLGLVPVIANFFSTSCGMACSFLLNRSFVFSKSDGRLRHEIIKFLIVTVVGLWVIQSLIIVACNWLLTGPLSLNPGVIPNATAKIIATCASLVWNYLWYNNYVFKNDK